MTGGGFRCRGGGSDSGGRQSFTSSNYTAQGGQSTTVQNGDLNVPDLKHTTTHTTHILRRAGHRQECTLYQIRSMYGVLVCVSLEISTMISSDSDRVVINDYQKVLVCTTT